MATKKARMRAPAEVRSQDDLCELQRDSVSSKTAWMGMNNDGSVHIYNQRTGEQSSGNVTLTKREFMQFYEWYVKLQRIVKY